MNTDQHYIGLPFAANGRSRQGIDCAGLAWLFLHEQFGLKAPAPQPNPEARAEAVLNLQPSTFNLQQLQRGSVVFFRYRPTGKIRHVSIYLGDGKFLNILAGLDSRIENGLTLMRRLGFDPVAAIPPSDADRLCAALQDPALGWQTVIMLLISIALSVVSGFLLRPSAQAFKNLNGKYGQANTGLATAKDPQLPLPDLLGTVVVAGNSIYQQLPNKSDAVSNSPPQAWNQIVVLESAPSYFIDPAGLQINGLAYTDASFHNGANVIGIAWDPLQDWYNAVDGQISGDTYVPSVTPRTGAYDIAVPIDARGYFDRSFPVYGMAGTSYLVFRYFDSSKFNVPNVTQRVLGRVCRAFDNTGFLSTTASGESLAGADGSKVRFKLTFEDLVSVSSLTVNGTSYTEISASTQSGSVFQVNKTKGFIEFTTAPAAGATILVTYDYYPRVFTSNPAAHLVYLLTEPRRGKAFPADRIDWPAADAAQQYFDQTVTWVGPDGAFSGPRYATNYSVDTRKPVQDHMQAILDACHSALFCSGGRFVILPVRDSASVFSFDTTNILLDDSGNSTFQADLVDRAPKSNRVRLAFHSEETLNAETEVVADDEDNQADRAGRGGDNGVVEELLKFPAITDASQAERLAETLLREHVGSNWQYTWLTSIQGLALQPGDLVDVTHPSLTTSAKLLRIDAIEHDENDRLKLTATEYVPSAYV